MSRADTTSLLVAWSAGDDKAGEALMERLYPELRQLAARRLRASGEDLTFEPTDLTHQAFLRLVDQRRTDWKDRAHFFAIAARVTRRVLVNYLRDRSRQKRGGGMVRTPLESIAEMRAAATRDSAAPPGSLDGYLDLLALEEALNELEKIDPRAVRLVELRYFGGLAMEEVADVLGVSRATAVRDWRSARIWLKDFLTEGAGY